MTTLLDCPDEVIIHILGYLSIQDLMNCQRVCRTLKDLYDSSSELQYFAELELAGMLDNPYCETPIADKLEMLRKREDAWNAFQPDFATTVPIPKPTSGVYDVTPHTYLLGVAHPNNEYKTVGLQSLKLPSSAKNADTRWSEIDMTRDVVDFGTSIEEHDLLAVITITAVGQPAGQKLLEIVLLRHSTGRPHELAEHPLIPVGHFEGNLTVSIEISGENLALVVIHSSDVDSGTLCFFDWKKGKRKGDPRDVYNWGLIFLREDLILSPNTLDQTLEITHIPMSSPTSPHEAFKAQVIHRLAFPKLGQGFRISALQCRCDPSPTAGNKFPKYTPNDRPFANDPERAIAVFTMDIRRFGELPESLAMFVHRRVVLDLLPEDWECNLLAKEPGAWSFSTVPWDQWGPQSARWLDARSFSSMFITSTAGQRFVKISNFASRFDSPISILDFNPYHVRKALTGHTVYPRVDMIVASESERLKYGASGSGEDDESDEYSTLGEPVAEENDEERNLQEEEGGEEIEVIGVDDVDVVSESFSCFEGKRVVSQLAYVQASTDTAYDYEAVLIDEQRIIGMRADSERPRSVNVIAVDIHHFG